MDNGKCTKLYIKHQHHWSLEVLPFPHPLLLSPYREPETNRLDECPEWDISSSKTCEADSMATQTSSTCWKRQWGENVFFLLGLFCWQCLHENWRLSQLLVIYMTDHLPSTLVCKNPIVPIYKLLSSRVAKKNHQNEPSKGPCNTKFHIMDSFKTP